MRLCLIVDYDVKFSKRCAILTTNGTPTRPQVKVVLVYACLKERRVLTLFTLDFKRTVTLVIRVLNQKKGESEVFVAPRPYPDKK